MRFKNRYYLVELIWEPSDAAASAPATATGSSSAPCISPLSRCSDVSLQSHHLYSALRECMALHFGELGAARCMQSMQVRYINSLTNIAIIRIARSDSRLFACVTSFMTHLRSKQILLRTIHLAGTIRNCQKKAVQLQRQRLAQIEAQIAPKEPHKGDHAALAGVIASALAKKNSISPQSTLSQLSSLLSQYNVAKSQQAAAATSHTASLAAKEAQPPKLAKSDYSVAATPESIQAAIRDIQQQGEAEIMAIDS